ncbi:MAG: 2-hydroxyacid dehydrogenase [Clostridia bacterium]|jgi:D-lactate dehydrogenase|nr:2-hydroxyacid dehydrogenase [Clostridia bacterium]
MKKKIAFFDTKAYDKHFFDMYNNGEFEIQYFESKLNKHTAEMTKGYDAVCAFVNDDINADVIDVLYENGIGLVALRCAGYNNVDIKHAYKRVHVTRVPSYSPNAVAEHAMALLLTLNRKIHRAYNRTREHNFSLEGLTGFDLYGKTVGVIGTGKIGRAFANICKGFGMKVVAYDLYPAPDADFEYKTLDEIFKEADIISLHCPLNEETRHMINDESLGKMKDGVAIINTSRGQLIDTQALIRAIKCGKVGMAGLDVYEEESEFFYEDHSNNILQDDALVTLISMPNVIVTSHQAFLTKEALQAIAQTTLKNMRDYFDDKVLVNEICYRCEEYGICDMGHTKNCF